MNILFIILVAVASIISLLLLIALFMKKKHYVKRDIIINAPRQRVFDYLKMLKNQDTFNKNAMMAPDRKKEFKGTDGEVGFIYAWSGDKNAGVGEKEIKNIIDGQRIEIEIRFIKPMTVTALITIETESLADNQTKVSWSNAGVLPYPVNMMIPVVEKSVAKDMYSSLTTLKNILEKSYS
ncbi:MAG: hypothetical protein JWO32_451 [Bacteroidetes bacterium]|nr:hypothetical protein [Bacteroidota bacterium]